MMFLFGFIAGFACCLVWVRYLTGKPELSDQEVIDAVAPDYWRFKHVKPEWYSHQVGEWDAITICTNCYRTALYRDQHVSRPCPDCGNKVVEKTWRGVVSCDFSGRWLPAMKKWEVNDHAECFYPPLEPQDIPKDIKEINEQDTTRTGITSRRS